MAVSIRARMDNLRLEEIARASLNTLKDCKLFNYKDLSVDDPKRIDIEKSLAKKYVPPMNINSLKTMQIMKEGRY